MKYVITKEQNDRLENLKKMSLKRHANKDSKELKGGMFDHDGKTIIYELYVRDDGSLYGRVTIEGKKYHIFIMNELDFLPLEKSEQEKISEYRIKKFFKKKNYSVTESQIKFLMENDSMFWVKRRVNQEFMEHYIWKAEQNYPMLCDDFGDEFDYADSVIEDAVNDFLTIQEETFLDDRYDEIHDILIEKCKDWFGEYLFEIYRMTCEEN